MKSMEAPQVILDGEVLASGEAAERLLAGTKAGRCTELIDAVHELLPPFVEAAAARPADAPSVALAVLELTGELGLHLAQRELPWVGGGVACSYGRDQRACIVLVERAPVIALLARLGEAHLADGVRDAGARELPVLVVAGHGPRETGIATTMWPLPPGAAAEGAR